MSNSARIFVASASLAVVEERREATPEDRGNDDPWRGEGRGSGVPSFLGRSRRFGGGRRLVRWGRRERETRSALVFGRGSRCFVGGDGGRRWNNALDASFGGSVRNFRKSHPVGFGRLLSLASFGTSFGWMEIALYGEEARR